MTRHNEARPCPIDWPQAVLQVAESLVFGIIGAGLALSIFLDWTVTP